MAAIAQDQPAVEATGMSPSRAYVSVLPWESIDAYSGSLVLTFTDLVLPGNAGFDLRVTRVFNSKRGAGWRIGPGFVRMAEDATSGSHVGDSPTIVTADGAEHLTFRAEAGSSLYRSLSYGQYDRTTHQLWLPNGVSYEYGCLWSPDASADNFPNARYPTAAWDAFGNRLTFEYPEGDCGPNREAPPKLTKISQDLGGGQVREVTFNYQGDRIHEMQYLDRIWTYTWDETDDRLLLAVTPPAGDGWAYGYAGPRVNLVTTPNGGQVLYTFDSQGGRGSCCVVTLRESLGVRDVPAGVWTFAYDGTTTTVDSPLNRTVYTFPTSGPFEGTPTKRETKTLADVVLETETLAWTAASRVGLDDTRGEEVRYAYGPLLTARTILRDGRTWSSDYSYHTEDFNDYGQAYQVDESGDFTRTTTRTFWNSDTHYIRGLVSGVTLSDGTTSYLTSVNRSGDGFVQSKTVYGVTTEYTADSFGNVEWETDANQHSTHYVYSWGMVSDVHAPAHTIVRTINPDGTVQTESRGGFSWQFGYDALGRETSRVLLDGYHGNAAMGATLETAYAADSVTTSRGASSTTTWLDGFGRTTGTENAVGVKTRVGYHPWGGRSYESDPFTGTTHVGTTFQYDALGRVHARGRPGPTSPTGVTSESSVTYEYAATASGLTVTITDEKSHPTVQTWQATGDPARARLAAVTDAAQATTSYTYDGLDTLVGVTHPGGSVTRGWAYDTHHWLTSETHPETGTVTYGGHDGVGNPGTRTDANGTLNYTYDNDNRVTDITVGSTGSPHDIHIAYDGWGNRWAVENGYVSRYFRYDAHRLTTIEDAIRPSGTGEWPEPRLTTEFGYDDRDNVERITYPAGPRRTVQYQYDAANRITKVWEENGPTYADSFSYDPSGGLAGYTAGNSIVTTITFDEPHQRGWPRTITAGGVLGLTYTYDAVGNVESITGAASGSQGFLYDELDRLTGATGPWGSETYQYDVVGNRQSREQNQQTTTYSYLNQRLTATGGTEVEGFSYDGAGRLTQDGRGSYGYTPFDLLQTATMASGVQIGYIYDADHVRTLSTASGTTRYFLRGADGMLLSELADQTGSQSWVRDYIYAGSRLLATVSAPPTAALLVSWGASGDVPVAADYDGDGRADLAVFRPGTGDWWIIESAQGYEWQTGYLHVLWGVAGDVPLTGDYDGDGRADIGVYRPSSGDWWVLLSSNGYRWEDGYLHLNTGSVAGDVPVPADYDGDGHTDVGIYRPSTGEWWVLLSAADYDWASCLHVIWGGAGLVAVPADYDGDGLADIGVFNSTTGDWWVVFAASQYVWQTRYLHVVWGTAGDVPAPGCGG
jgi:YD repeat-containing protein